MNLSDLKTLFRRNIKVVPGGPAVGTTGSNRAAGVLDALDKLAEFAADQAAQSIPFTYTIQPADVTSPASDIVIAIPEALSFGAVYIEVPGVTGMDRLAPSNYSGAPGQLTLSASISPALQPGYVVHVYYQEGSVQAGGVQSVNNIAADSAGNVNTVAQRTGTDLEFDREADYAEIQSGTMLVKLTGSGASAAPVRAASVTVKVLLKAGCTAIVLDTRFFELLGTGVFAAGQAHCYMFSTSTPAGKIQYTVNRRNS